jgi:hypothetical protein
VIYLKITDSSPTKNINAIKIANIAAKNPINNAHDIQSGHVTHNHDQSATTPILPSLNIKNTIKIIVLNLKFKTDAVLNVFLIILFLIFIL